MTPRKTTLSLSQTSPSHRRRPRPGIVLATLALAAATLVSKPAAALDSDADDYSAGAVPAGTNLALLYYQHANRNKVRVDGATVSPGDLTSDIGILRLVRFVKIGPFLADPQVLLPFGKLQGHNALASLGSTDGLADAIVTATVWLINEPENGTYLGVTPAVYVPIGQYDHDKPLNLGEHRWKYLFQSAYVMPVGTPNLSLQVTGDVTLYGRNDDYGAASQTLKQKPLVELQAWLRYKVTPTFDVRVGSAHFTGGRTELDGVSNADRQNTTNMKVGFGWDFSPGWNLVAAYGQDLQVRNGLQEDARFNLRLLKAF